MGMFDTVILSQPVVCPKCGNSIIDTQTKIFDCYLRVIDIGDVVSLNNEYTDGIYEDTLYCKKCHNNISPVYFKVEKNVLIDVSVNKKPDRQLIDIVNIIAKQRTEAKYFIFEIAKTLEYMIDYYYFDKKEKAKELLKSSTLTKLLHNLKFKPFSGKNPNDVLIEITQQIYKFLEEARIK